MIVHIILPSGVRYQVSFADHCTGETILKAIASQKYVYGGTIAKKLVRDSALGQNVAAEDATAGYWYDHPDTVVAIVKVINGAVVEVKRLKGPPIAPPEPPAAAPIAPEPPPVAPEPVAVAASVATADAPPDGG